MNLRHITLHQLRLVHSLGKHLSFTRAAEEMHLSQPAMSIQIKRLEESVGMPLVEKMGKRLFLTEAGRELFEASRDVHDRLKVLNEDMIGMDEGVKGPLNLSAITTAKYFMPHLLGVKVVHADFAAAVAAIAGQRPFGFDGARVVVGSRRSAHSACISRNRCGAG